MTLLARLGISHALLASTLALALALLLASHGRIYRLMGEVRERELEVLDQEEAVYRAAWDVELAARQAAVACAHQPPENDPVGALRAATGRLRAMLATATAPRLMPVATRYARFGEKVLAAEQPCAMLNSSAIQEERGALDEQATEAWIARSYELHRAIRSTEEEARETGRRALWTGFTLFAATLVVAGLLARWLAPAVTRPLGRLAGAAQRIGRGDFSPVGATSGPVEVAALGRALDDMREQLAQLDALKAGFVASVSHELRSPLAQLREALALLRDGAAGPLDGRQAEVVEIAHAACEKEIRLVTSLLDLSRLRAGGPLRLELERSIDAVVREAVREEEPAAAARGVRIETALPGSAPPALLDEPLLVRAVANLIRNAVSVSPHNGVVRVARELVGGRARVRVSDQGPGVPAEARARLFEAFGARDVPGVSRRAGVGLGLTLAREIARAHGGDVELDDGVARGACFVLTVPLQEGARARARGVA